MKKLFIILLLGILLVGTLGFFILQKDITQKDVLKPTSQIIETAQGKIIKEYVPSEKTITLKDVKTKVETLNAKLDTPHIYKVDVGYGMVAQFTINSYQDYSNVLGEFEFYNVKKRDQINREINVKYLTIQSVEVDDFKTECITLFGKNETQSCTQIKIGSHLEDKEIWLPFDNSIKTNEKVIIGLFTDVRVGDRVEWIPTIAGVKVQEWAEWVAASVNFVANATSAADLTTYNFTSVNFGAVNETRVLLIGASGGANTKTISSLSVSGTSASFINRTQSSGYTGEMWYANVSTGTTGYVTVTWSGAQLRMGIAVWALYDTTKIPYYSNGSAWNSGYSALLNIPDNGVAVGFSYTNKATIAWTNLTKDFQSQNDEAGFKQTGASDEFVTGQTNYLVKVETQDSRDSMVVVSFAGEPRGLEITLLSPENNTNFAINNINFSANVSDPGFLGIKNVSTVINGIINQTNSSGFEGIYNFPITLPNGNWNYTIIAYDDSNNLHTATNGTFIFAIKDHIVNSITYNSTSYETASETFYANITTNGTASTNGKLIYDGTSYSATITNTNGNDYNISRAIDIPIGTGNKTFFFNFTLSGTEYSTTLSNQTINPTNLTLVSNTTCSGGYSPYINFSFADEGNLSKINGAISSSLFEYYLGSGSANKTLSALNVTENPYYLLCLFPQNRTINIDYSISYKSTNYPQRTNNPPPISFTNSTTNTTLYLLSSSDGLYITFQLLNTAGQVLEGATTNITKLINGIDTLINSGVTGADGGITYWLNPDNLYTANFFLSPYPLYSITQQFTQSSYTITLGSTASEESLDYQKGITYSVEPTATYLENGTIYAFNFTINSSYWSLEEYGFNITNGSGTFIGSASDTVSGGSKVSLSVNTSGNRSLIMSYYWIINGTITTASRNWLVIDLSGNQFSISHLIGNFIAYTTTGLFGLNSFGIGLICFIVIIATTGVLKLKWGISNEASLLGAMWALVALFDVSFGILPNPVGAIDNFPTVFMGLIFMGVMFKEVFT